MQIDTYIFIMPSATSGPFTSNNTFNFSLAPFHRYNIELIFKFEKETFVHMIVPETKKYINPFCNQIVINIIKTLLPPTKIRILTS